MTNPTPMTRESGPDELTPFEHTHRYGNGHVETHTHASHGFNDHEPAPMTREPEDCPRCDGTGFIPVDDGNDEDNCGCECHHDEHEPSIWSDPGAAVRWQDCAVCAIPEHDSRLRTARLRLGMRGNSMPETTDD